MDADLQSPHASCAGSQTSHPTCVLCSLTNSSDAQVNCITTYIAESISNVSLQEICTQVSKNLLEYCQIHESTRHIYVHITQHMTDQRVVLVNILRDLVDLATTTRKSCVMTCEETGAEAIDTKGLMAYLKTVDQITSIYKMESMKCAGKRET